MSLTKSKLALGGTVLTGVVALTTAGTLALFTDTKTITANTFSTGSISLTTDSSTMFVTFADMMPGDKVTNPLVVTNAGSESLRYAVSSVASNVDTKGLKDQLILTVRTVDTTTPLTPCTEFDGTSLYTGDLDASAGLILGSAVTGQTGVAVSGGDRTLAAGVPETLCVRVEMPLNSANSFQGASSTAVFTFAAEQTKNNP